MDEQKSISQLIIEVEDYDESTYLIRISKVLMPDFQRALIEGSSRDNITVFFNLKLRR